MHTTFLCTLRTYQLANVTENSRKHRHILLIYSITSTCEILILNSLYFKRNKKDKILIDFYPQNCQIFPFFVTGKI